MRAVVDNQGNFSSTWVPIELIKGKDGKTTKMRIGGIASTSTQDDDGEFLDPQGFDLDYLLSDGYFNWNHQVAKDPTAIVGRPDKAIITKKGLEVEGDLFDSQKAKDVYSLGQLLEKEGLNLGFSIEGKALERGSEDVTDPLYKRVLKARITGIAITPNPKNKDAVANIIKGHSFNSLSAYQDKSEEETEKAMSAGSESGAAIAKESLDHNSKVTTFTKEEPDKEVKLLTKGEVYNKLFTDNPQLDGPSADRLYSLMHKIEKIKIMKTDDKTLEKVSEESFQKALSVIDDLEKGYGSAKKMAKGDDDGEEEEEEDDDKKEDKKIKKAKGSKKTDEDGDDDMSKSISPEQLEAATLILESAGFAITPIADLNKGIVKEQEEKEEGDIKSLIKGLKGDLQKAIGSDIENKFSKHLAAVPALGTITKSILNTLEELTEKVDLIGQNSPGVKSVTKAAAIEKGGDKGNDLEKGVQTTVLSVSNPMHKKVMLDDLEKSYLSEENGKINILNKGLADETMIYESSGQVSKNIVEHFAKKNIKLIA